MTSESAADADRGGDSAAKPAFRSAPGAYLRRQLRLKLNDVLGFAGLRVVDRVGMSAIRTSARFNHVIDVGVASGTPDLYARCPGARIELFEPSPQFYEALETGLMRRRECRLHKMALGAESGEATLHLTGSTSASILGSGEKPGRTFPAIAVALRRLDDVIAPSDLLRPAVLKIDTEGYELAVLQGAERLLWSIDLVIIELHLGKSHAYRPQQILDLMARHGFALIDILDQEVRNHRVVCCDMVFERGVAV